MRIPYRWIALLCFVKAMLGSANLLAQPSSEWEQEFARCTKASNGGVYQDAIRYCKRAADMAEAIKPGSFEHGLSFLEFARFFDRQNEFERADKLYQIAFAILSKIDKPSSRMLSDIENARGELLRRQGRWLAAEERYKLALRIADIHSQDNRSEISKILSNLALVLNEQGKPEDALVLIQRSIALYETYGEKRSAIYATLLSNQGGTLFRLGRYADAGILLKQAFSILESILPTNDSRLAAACDNIALTLTAQNQFDQAEDFYLRSRKIIQANPGAPITVVATNLNNLAGMYFRQKKYDLAKTHFTAAIAKLEAGGISDHPDIAKMMTNLALVYAEMKDYDNALTAARKATSYYHPHGDAGGYEYLPLSSPSAISAMQVLAGRIADKYAQTPSRRLLEEGFLAVQDGWRTATSNAVAQTGARAASGSANIAESIRIRQASIEVLDYAEGALLNAVSLPEKDRNKDQESKLRTMLKDTRRNIQELGAEISTTFPAYWELTSPDPIPLSEAQMLLAENEALISWHIQRDETIFFIVRKKLAVFEKIAVPHQRIVELVRRLRASIELPLAGDPLPFSHADAHKLYELLFGPIEKHLSGVNHLILIPDGPLQSLSFGMLKIGAGETANESTPWLARRYALTTLPAITSLRALRKFAKTSGQREPFVGFGDPDLKGDGDGTRGVKIARLFARGLIADTRAVAEMQPLPETANELKSIAKTLKADENSIYLRQAATESMVKKMPLNKYRTVAFATHGIMAGEFKGVQEPALVLTPPVEGSEDDDGLLTASEVAGLKLDADWVILSACNTAAPDGTPGAQGFSGLTKAFFYAGARSLLVSHWAVESNSAMKLTTRMFEEIEKGATKSEALRRSMMALADDPETSHPAFWAPFVVVGEGAR